MNRITTLLLTASLSLIMSAHLYAVPRYHVIPIVSGSAEGINEKGDVVGETATTGVYVGGEYFYANFGGGHAFIFKQVTPTFHSYIDLGVYNSPPHQRAYETAEGMAVNNSDTVVGGIVNFGPPIFGVTDYGAFVYKNGAMSYIAEGSSDGGMPAYATSINNKGDVVGTLDINTFLHYGFGQGQAFLYRNGVVTPLGTLNTKPDTVIPYSIANSINNAGQIVGLSTSDSGKNGFLWMNGKMSAIGRSSFVPVSINDNGWIAGSDSSGAVLYIYGLTIQIGAGEAVSVNNSGTVIGYVGIPTTGVFIYVIGQRYDLNTLVDGGWKITDVGQINDAGQIAATGTRSGSTVAYALLLTPVRR
jgi:probable HAF family extracellular repeat protein